MAVAPSAAAAGAAWPRSSRPAASLPRSWRARPRRRGRALRGARRRGSARASARRSPGQARRLSASAIEQLEVDAERPARARDRIDHEERPERLLDGRAREGALHHGEQVLQIVADAIERLHGSGAGPVIGRGLADGEVVGRVSLLGDPGLAAGRELLLGQLAHRLVQEKRAGAPGARATARSSDLSRSDCTRSRAGSFQHRVGRLQREAAAEDRAARARGGRARRGDPTTTRRRRAAWPAARGRRGALAQHVEPLFEAREERVEAEQVGARRGQLDGEGDPSRWRTSTAILGEALGAQRPRRRDRGAARSRNSSTASDEAAAPP